MKYKVELLKTSTTSKGKPMYHCNLTDESGSVEAINLFDKVENGQELEGEIYTNDKGYRNFKSNAQKAKSNFVNKQKTEQMVEVMQVKQQNIRDSQEFKQSSVQVSATFRDATSITLAEMEYVQHNGDYAGKFQERWIYWRDWLNKNFDPQQPPF